MVVTTASVSQLPMHQIEYSKLSLVLFGTVINITINNNTANIPEKKGKSGIG